MTATNVDIERIVREVIRRLQSVRAGDTAAANSNRGPKQDGAATDTEREMKQRVISLAALDGQLEGVRRIRVPRGAVVTPSARDELRRRGVTVQYLGCGRREPTSDTLVVASWKTDYSSDALLQWVQGDGHQASAVDGNDPLPALLETVDGTDSTTDAGRLGLVLTDHPSLALCLANRQPRIRAAWAVDMRAVDEAVKSIAPNVLIVEPQRASWSLMVSMVRAYLGSGGGACPRALATGTAASSP